MTLKSKQFYLFISLLGLSFNVSATELGRGGFTNNQTESRRSKVMRSCKQRDSKLVCSGYGGPFSLPGCDCEPGLLTSPQIETNEELECRQDWNSEESYPVVTFVLRPLTVANPDYDAYDDDPSERYVTQYFNYIKVRDENTYSQNGDHFDTRYELPFHHNGLLRYGTKPSDLKVSNFTTRSGVTGGMSETQSQNLLGNTRSGDLLFRAVTYYQGRNYMNIYKVEGESGDLNVKVDMGDKEYLMSCRMTED